MMGLFNKFYGQRLCEYKALQSVHKETNNLRKHSVCKVLCKNKLKKLSCQIYKMIVITKNSKIKTHIYF